MLADAIPRWLSAPLEMGPLVACCTRSRPLRERARLCSAAVPLYSPSDRLPIAPERVIVGGTSGAGKSTLAKRIGAALDLPYLEVDSIYHGPGWTVRPEFQEELRAFVAHPRWVVEWQGEREMLAGVADTLVWLDYPVPVVMYRVVKRNLRRSFSTETLWAGNVEPPLWALLREPEHIVRWAWRTRHRASQDVRRLVDEGTTLQVVRLRAPSDAERWLRLSASPRA